MNHPDWIYLAFAIFIPLFPMSMLFNALYARIRSGLVRMAMLLLCPQAGLWLMSQTSMAIPDWLMPWAVGTALLYALRALVLRELGLWTAFLATSAWALLWLPLLGGLPHAQLQVWTLALSLPFILLAWLGVGLERRFGAAYTGLYGGLALTMPRYSGVLVCVVMAIMATPLFPGFFVLLDTIVTTAPVAPAIALGVGVVWLLWTWAGARLLQGLVVGRADRSREVDDLSLAGAWLYALLLLIFILAGVAWYGGMTWV